MARLMKAGESNAVRRRVYFYITAVDGITPATGEAGNQPLISVNGAAFSATGISAMTSFDHGFYYAEVAQSLLVAGNHIEVVFTSNAVADSPGDAIDVVGFDPFNAVSLGVSDIADAAEFAEKAYDEVKTPRDIAIVTGQTNNVRVTTDSGKGRVRDISITGGVRG